MTLFAKITSTRTGETYLVEVPTNDPVEAHTRMSAMFDRRHPAWAHLEYHGIVAGDKDSDICPGCGQNHDGTDEADWPDVGAAVLYTLTLALAALYYIHKTQGK